MSQRDKKHAATEAAKDEAAEATEWAEAANEYAAEATTTADTAKATEAAGVAESSEAPIRARVRVMHYPPEKETDMVDEKRPEDEEPVPPPADDAPADDVPAETPGES